MEYVNKDNIKPELLYTACRNPMIRPITHTICRSSYCSNCICGMLWKCTVCNSRNEKQYVEVIAQCFLNLINRILVQCTQCKQIMQLKEFNERKTTCLCK